MSLHPSKAPLSLSLYSKGMMALLVAQFLSALADNAILIAAIALFKLAGTEKNVPLLQAVFVVPFILLAPYVGRLSDRFPKARVMLFSNLVKTFGAAAMLLGSPPLLAYGLIGIGAAAYSPAKYGILSQLFSPTVLVRANGFLEGSTIAAILLGVVLGGWLSDYSLTTAFWGVLICYGLATIANLAIPQVAAEDTAQTLSLWRGLFEFKTVVVQLFSDPHARFSLLGTSLFWGSGSTLRLLLFSWVPLALGMADNQTPANLMGVLSMGIVAGALVAGNFISLFQTHRALLGGLLLGPLIVGLSVVTRPDLAFLLMACIGFCGGVFVVPLNALLQMRGHVTMGAGSALAVQNFAENLAMLLLVGASALATACGVSANFSVAGFGVLLCVLLTALSYRRPRTPVVF